MLAGFEIRFCFVILGSILGFWDVFVILVSVFVILGSMS